MADDIVSIAGTGLSASINPLGAELWTLRDAQGRDLLWNGDAAFWAGRAPILFPIVGTLKNGRYRVGEKTFELPRHGFGRRRRFETVQVEADRAVFRLISDAETRGIYPFDFQLDLSFRIEASRLDIAAELVNTGREPLPASFGYHPAFRWPLPYGADRAGHRIIFADIEPAPSRRLEENGLLDAAPRPTPIHQQRLDLDDGLFTEDALIFTKIASQSLRYGADSSPQLKIDYPDTPHLAFWSKPDASFICIEPWQGYSDPAGLSGEIWQKPGVAILQPDERRQWRLGIELEA